MRDIQVSLRPVISCRLITVLPERRLFYILGITCSRTAERLRDEFRRERIKFLGVNAGPVVRGVPLVMPPASG